MQLTAETLREIMPFGAHMEMVLVRASPDEVVATMEWAPETTTTGGAMR